jgi:hypothetical protein
VILGPGGGGILLESAGGGTSFCLHGAHERRQPRSGCQEGRLTVAGPVDPHATAVRLRLSDGRSVSSSTYEVPASAGGPARIYVQALSGPAPIPVSLTELAPDGRALRTVALRPVHGCRREPVAPPPISVTLVRGQTPAGQPFAITGNTFFGGGPPRRLSSTFTLFLIAGDAEREPTEGGYRREVLSWHAGIGCGGNPFAILYGVLAPPAENVIARVAGTTVALTRVPIPPRMHAHGVLVYGVFRALPSELTVQARDGRTLRRIDLRRRGAESAQFCEGYGEG